jgi:hypothetical protein
MEGYQKINVLTDKLVKKKAEESSDYSTPFFVR